MPIKSIPCTEGLVKVTLILGLGEVFGLISLFYNSTPLQD
jgi:hypothetical protein